MLVCQLVEISFNILMTGMAGLTSTPLTISLTFRSCYDTNPCCFAPNILSILFSKHFFIVKIINAYSKKSQQYKKYKREVLFSLSSQKASPSVPSLQTVAASSVSDTKHCIKPINCSMEMGMYDSQGSATRRFCLR